jgi:hypothetical protein
LKNPRDIPPLSDEVAETVYEKWYQNRQYSFPEISKMIFLEAYRLRLIEKCPHNDWHATKRGKLLWSLLEAMHEAGCLNLSQLEVLLNG